jgi:hypothetical protein
LGGSYANAGFKVFRHRLNKNDHDALRQVSLFISTCVKKAVVILDDANTWATAADLQQLAGLVSNRANVRVIATWTNDDSEDGAKIHASDLPKQVLTWSDLRPAVVETLLTNEREVVEALQKYEDDRSIGSLGFGSLGSKLKDRIHSLGEKPKTVYEFIFGLRGGGKAVADEFRQLVDDDRSDLPMLFAAIEQIADFERPISISEAALACSCIQTATGLPTATESWVHTVLQRQVQKKRLVRVRDCFTTIHRKWAARLIAAGLSSLVAKSTTEELLKSDFRIPSTRPERLLRLWSWLRTLDESRPFIQEWVRTMSPGSWSILVGNCVRKGLMEVSFLAGRMHLLLDVADWRRTVGTAFEGNASLIAPLVYDATPGDWYWLRELSMAMNYACPEAWAKILQGWDRKSVADLLLNTRPDQFETVSWTLNDTPKLCPGWLEEVGMNMSWEAFAPRFQLVESGDLRSLFKTISVFGTFGKSLKRSMLRTIAEATQTTLHAASLDDIRMPMTDITLVILTLYFPDDARRAFGVLDVKGIGRQLSRSLPRHWRSLLELSFWADSCGSNVVATIISECDIAQLEQQAQRFGPTNRHELRLLLHLLSRAKDEVRRSVAETFYSLVRQACEPNDAEARSIITAYNCLNDERGSILAAELGILPEHTENKREAKDLQQALKATRQKYRELDAKGEDYEITDDAEPNQVPPDAASALSI